MRGREGLNSKLGFTRKTSYISKMREWESVGTWLRHQAMLLVYIGCVPLLCQGSKCMAYNGKSVWLAFRRSWVQILAGYQIFFFRGFTSHSLSKKNIISYSKALLWYCGGVFDTLLDHAWYKVYWNTVWDKYGEKQLWSPEKPLCVTFVFRDFPIRLRETSEKGTTRVCLLFRGFTVVAFGGLVAIS